MGFRALDRGTFLEFKVRIQAVFTFQPLDPESRFDTRQL